MQVVRRAIAELMPDWGDVTACEAVGGGCISQAMRVAIIDPSGAPASLFVKSNERNFVDNFRCEQNGLARLSAPAVIGVPRPLALGCVDERAWLVLEWIDQGRRDETFFGTFGSSLAELHRLTRGTTIGLDHDNFLGAAPQPNQQRTSWPEFVAEQRLGFQLRWAVDQGRAIGSFRRDLEQIVWRISDLLSGRAEETSLLHGDLWSGNYLANAAGQPVLIDPAIYYGCREAEFGMLKLFGACPVRFYRSYESAWALPDGWHRRVNVYVLYHLLNHLNLFGDGYAGQCRSVAAEILSSVR